MLANCLQCFATVPYLSNGERPKFCTSCGKSMSLTSSSSAPKKKVVAQEEEEESSGADISQLKCTVFAGEAIPKRKFTLGDLVNSDGGLIDSGRGMGNYGGTDVLGDIDKQIMRRRHEVDEDA